MKQNLKHSFFQVFTAVFIWLTFIITKFFMRGASVDINYLWNIVAGALILALLFGVLYNALWYHLTLKPIWNIVIATIANAVGGWAFLYLVFNSMFWAVWKWFPGMLLLNFILHAIAFQVYAKYECKKQTAILNKMIEQ